MNENPIPKATVQFRLLRHVKVIGLAIHVQQQRSPSHDVMQCSSRIVDASVFFVFVQLPARL